MKIINKKGMTLIETLLSLSVLAAAVTGGMIGQKKVSNYLNEKALTKDITTILRAVDTRVSIDGYSFGAWTSSSSATGKTQIAKLIKQNFISKHDSVCGVADGWEPQLVDEKYRKFVNCDFWQNKLPFNAEMKIDLTESSQGFLNNFDINIDLPSAGTGADDMRERFEKMLSIMKSLNSNDYANKNGLNAYRFVDKSNNRLSNIECSTKKSDCIIQASWNKQGFSQPLKVDGGNAMVSSNISFIVNKTNHEELTDNCILWEEQSSASWVGTQTECGIGSFSINGTMTPTTVQLPINEITAVEKIVLSKKCDVFARDSGNGIKKVGESPCGLIAEVDLLYPTKKIVVQPIDHLDVPEMLITEHLYSDNIQNVDVVNVAIDLYNDLSNSEANLDLDLVVDGEAVFTGTVDFIQSLIIGDGSTPLTTKSVSIGDLTTFGSYFQVNENAKLTNVTLDNTAATSVPTEVQVLRAFDDNSGVMDLRTSFFVPNKNYQIDDACPNTSAFTVDSVSKVVLTCRQSWKAPSKKTWQSNYYGEIGAFKESCPKGWNEIEDFHSRMLIGTGTYSEAFMEAKTFLSRDMGGEAFVYLEKDQMPEHKHATPKFDHICKTCHRGVKKEDCPAPYTWYAYENRCVTSQGLSKTRDGRAVFSNDSQRMSNSVGGNYTRNGKTGLGGGHNNLPSYTAVAYCVYGEGDGKSPNINTPPSTGPDWVPYSAELSGWLDDVSKKFYNCGTAERIYSPEEGITYTNSVCQLDQYQLKKEREIDLNSGTVRFSGVVNRNYRTITETQIFKEQPWTYGEWGNISSPYNCTKEKKWYDPITDQYYKKKFCDVDQARNVHRYEIDIRFGDKRLMPQVDGVKNPFTEYRTERLDYKRIVAAGGFKPLPPEDLQTTEGSFGTQTEISLDIVLSKSFSEPVTYRVSTQDITTTSILSETENLIYDQFGNPFISVVDNQNGGRLMFDGGFPKFYNQNLKGNPKKFKDLPIQFKFMNNVIKWVGETHKSRGKVLLYGDRLAGTDHYHIKSTGGAGFRKSIPHTIDVAGFDPVVKDYQDYGGVYGSKQASISSSEMSKYSAIIVMSSGGWDSLDNETANNFTTYVNNGGGVYIITDHSWFQKTGNQILKKFGSEFYGVVDRVGSDPAYKMSTIWAALNGTKYNKRHDLWDGLSSSDSIAAGGSEGNVKLFTPVQDYIGISEDIVFLPGEKKKTIKIILNGDDLAEGNEQFKIVLTSPDTGVIVGTSELIYTIIDDDTGIKSMTSLCGMGVLSFDDSCVKSTSNPVKIKNNVVSTENEKVTGTIQVRYQKDGNREVVAKIGNFDLKTMCEGDTLKSLISRNGTDILNKGDGDEIAKIKSIDLKDILKWSSKTTDTPTFKYNEMDCKGFLKGFDANIEVVAEIETTWNQKVPDCDGTVKDGLCLMKEVYEPTKFCGDGYTKAEDWCIKD